MAHVACLPGLGARGAGFARLLSLNQFGWLVVDEMRSWQPPDIAFGILEPMRRAKELDKAYYVWLACAVRIIQPTNILELGTYQGHTALAMYSEMMPDCRLTSVDIDPSKRNVPPQMESDPRIRFVAGDDLDIRIFDGAPPRHVDFLFIDTEHSCDHVSAEWELYRRYLRDGAMVTVDDVCYGDVLRWWDSIPCEKAIEYEHGHSTGFGYFFFEEGQFD